ncbi:MAG: FliI/YscN family ATPase [Paracoccaceae bacterium]
MPASNFDSLTTRISSINPVAVVGRVAGNSGPLIRISGISDACRIGDRVRIRLKSGRLVVGEVLRLGDATVEVLPERGTLGLARGDEAILCPPPGFFPHESWVGRIVNADGQPLDNRPLQNGATPKPLVASPVDPVGRRPLGARLETGFRLFNTMLPLAVGQRMGLFAGSGIGKSTLIGQFARNVQTDVVVIALVGERGRELRSFVDQALGPEGLKRAVVVVATSDRPALEKRRAAWAATAVAEYFRDLGRNVLLVVDSITRFAEAHREIALASGETASMRGFPPSVAQMIMSLCERAGPGTGASGNITALFSVLVAGSDMEEPIADIVRGVLDGHVVLDREIAERGRFPAVDVLRSVSRSLPDVANERENALIQEARQMLGAYESSELMIKAGLYAKGADALTDRAVAVYPGLDRFFSEPEDSNASRSFQALAACLAEATETPDENPQ